MARAYQNRPRRDTRKLTQFFHSHQELLLPFVDLIESSKLMIGELMGLANTALVESVLTMSAQKLAGPKQRGRRGEDVCWHGSQRGKITLSDRKLQVRRPRLCRRGGGEVAIPAYDALQSDEAFARRVEELAMKGVSTRDYASVIGELAETVGVSKSSVSREFIEASAQSLEALIGRRWDGVDLLVIYVDGVRFGDHLVLAALGVDSEGKKHVLGVVPGASENLEAAVRLLEGLAERGVDPSRRYLWVIDGAKALRSAILRVYGEKQRVQRCRLHKMRNVRGELPEDLGKQAVAVMRAAFRLEAKEGKKKLQEYARWLEKAYPGGAASLREGLEELFTISELGIAGSLARCLGSTNIIESPFGTVQKPMRRVRRWQDGSMVVRWVASSMLAAEKKFRRIMGYKDLWQLGPALGRKEVKEARQLA